MDVYREVVYSIRRAFDKLPSKTPSPDYIILGRDLYEILATESRRRVWPTGDTPTLFGLSVEVCDVERLIAFGRYRSDECSPSEMFSTELFKWNRSHSFPPKYVVLGRCEFFALMSEMKIEEERITVTKFYPRRHYIKGIDVWSIASKNIVCFGHDFHYGIVE